LISEVPNKTSISNVFEYHNTPKSSKLDVDYFVEITSESKWFSRDCEADLDLYYNKQKIGNVFELLQQGPIKCPPIKSITNDCLEVCSTGTQTYFTKTIFVHSISWKLGQTFNFRDVMLHLELKSTSFASPGIATLDKSIESTRWSFLGEDKITNIYSVIKKLLHIIYFDSLCTSSNQLSSHEFVNGIDGFLWDGSLEGNSKDIISLLRPYCSEKEWQAMTLWTILGIRTIFPEIRGKILYGQLRYLEDIRELNYNEANYGFNLSNGDTLDLYRTFCMEKIVKFDENDSDKAVLMEEMQFMAKNLMLITRNDDETATENLCAAISQKIQKEVSNQIQRKSRATENIPKLSNLLCGYESSLSIIHDKFGEFGVEIWCPAFALSVIKVVLPTLDVMKPKIGSKQSEKQKELIEEFIPLYMKIKNMFQYVRGSKCQSTKSKFYSNFEPCISTLLDLIKEKGKHQIILAVNEQKQSSATSPVPDTSSYESKLIWMFWMILNGLKTL